MSQMKSLGSGIRLTASDSIFQILIQLTFIEQLYLPGNELSASTCYFMNSCKSFASEQNHGHSENEEGKWRRKVSGRTVVGARSFSIVLWLPKLSSRDGVCTSH